MLAQPGGARVLGSEQMLRGGDVIGGRYRLVTPLASGGMGTVWRAEHTELHAEVALKLMLPESASTPSGEARFRREAQAAARLRSPHVVRVHDFGIFDGQPYLAMELLQGEDLDARLAKSGTLPLDACAKILDGVADALDLAHQHGIVHRDLKPANIFLADEGGAEIVKVLDFGVAKVDGGLEAGSTTGSGVLGSPPYMSPEQVWNDPVTFRSDLWSMAVVLFEMLVGENPFFAGALAKVFERIVRDDLPRPSNHRSDLPPSLDAFFARALERDPSKRFASAGEMAKAFRDATSEVARHVDPRARTLEADAAPPVRGDRGGSKVIVRIAAVLGGALIAAAVLVSVSRSTSEAPVGAPPAPSSSTLRETGEASPPAEPVAVPPPIGTTEPSRPLATANAPASSGPASGPSARTRRAEAGPSTTAASAQAAPSTAPSVDPLFGIPQGARRKSPP